MMIDENPNFYFKHLSFAQVLGLTKTWEKKFAKIDVPQPSWYIVPSYGMYSLARMNNVSTSLNKSLNVPLEKYCPRCKEWFLIFWLPGLLEVAPRWRRWSLVKLKIRIVGS